VKDIYAWVPWFEELAQKIAEGGEAYLVECAKRIDWQRENPALLQYGDEFIDPFSFIYFLAQKCTKNQTRTVYAGVSEVFGIDDTKLLSEDSLKYGLIFPIPQPKIRAVFHSAASTPAPEGNPSLLWRLFRQAVSGGNLVSADFKAAFDINNVGVQKLTQCLFLINPRSFMPVDKGTLLFNNAIGAPSYAEAKRKLKQENGLQEYEAILDRFRAAFPACEFYEMNTAILELRRWMEGNTHVTGERFFQTVSGVESDYRLTIAELIEYLRNEGNAMKHPLNQILFGPPGTGKTWNAVNHALAIVEGALLDDIEREERGAVKARFEQLKEAGQIAMVTFHQSFSYEDFIEGIKPVLGDDSDSVQYEIVDGVFKQIANRARENIGDSSQDGDTFDLDVLLQDFAQHINEKSEQGEAIKLHQDAKYSHRILRAETSSRGGVRFVLKSDNMVGEMNVSSRTIRLKYREFLSGEIAHYRDIKPIYKSQSSYHGLAIYIWDLMRAMKSYQDLEWQPVKKSVQERQNYVLVIDEINRGNIAKIFGELITLIEPSKRLAATDAATVTLPYSKDEEEPFGVPDNLYLVGTMNTADRSIALLDTALRRRFEFVEMMPQPNHARISADINGVNCREMLAAINKRICVLLDREHQIGHSYFIGVSDLAELARVFRHRIIPLLQEYFYDDWERIYLVLNKNAFIRARRADENLFGGAGTVDAERLFYELAEGAAVWESPDNYRKIYANAQPDDGDDE